ncbi:hypothetical protein TSL6_10280 [Sulfurovum sp. TSL6]|uniref:WecB/TagA/CpsF family glycosyltransferase n=1 Tax=Sulfurovum sp. TSL6 TaxID=2826995 RepID=UPI001CC6D94B|nr:WecB/TagA/CpsF family glycosyltransferase [Sulfurovum sp. TSL6]GIU00522.1 hypothetical protein TSL6_10280 [Sulfurovum sp. TSL6]
MKSRVINGLKIHAFEDKQELLEYIEDKKTILIAINAEKIMNKNEKLRKIINENTGYTDGVGAVMFVRQKRINSAKIAGAELWLDIVNHFQDKKFYFLGATQEVIEQTIHKLKLDFPHLNIVGYRNGYLDDAGKEILKEELVEKKPDIVFIAQGSPRQEILMDELIKAHPALYMGLGGSFDVYCGLKKRAPKLFIDSKLEWLYRLLKEPTRIKRQLALLQFLFLMLRIKHIKISKQELTNMFARTEYAFLGSNIKLESSIHDFDEHKFRSIVNIKNNKYGDSTESFHRYLENLDLYDGKWLTMAGILFFSKYPQDFYPSFGVKLVSSTGSDEKVQEIGGTIDDMYENTLISLFDTVKEYYNYDEKELALLKPILEGLLLNAILHRDYTIDVSIKILLLENKIEIINPGKLMPPLTVGNIQNGIKIQRNPILYSIASKVINHKDIDTSIERLVEQYPNIDFYDNTDIKEFTATVGL